MVSCMHSNNPGVIKYPSPLQEGCYVSWSQSVGKGSIIQWDAWFIGKSPRRTCNYFTSTVSLQNLFVIIVIFFCFFVCFFFTLVPIDLQPLSLTFTVRDRQQLHEAEIIDNAPRRELFCVPCWNASVLWKASARETVKGVCRSFLRYPARGHCIKQVPISGREAWTSEVTRWHHSVLVFSLQSVTITKKKCLVNFPKTSWTSTHRKWKTLMFHSYCNVLLLTNYFFLLHN